MNRIVKIKNLYKAAMPRPYGSLFEIESSDTPSEEFDSEKVTSEQSQSLRTECEERVCWYGNKDRMIRVDVDYAYPVFGNQFYPDLIKKIEDRIRAATHLNPARLHCGYCNVKKIGISDIEEDLQYDESDSEFTNRLTTGNDELDKYLKDKEEYLSDHSSAYEKDEIEEMLKDAIENQDGDIGKYIYQVRNGNHRVFAAKNAGEKYVWLNISINDFESLKSDEYGIYEDYSELKKSLNI